METARSRRLTAPRTDVTDVTTYAYDTQGNLTSVTQPLNLVTTYSDYTATGQPQTVTDPTSVDTTYTYDSVGRVTSVTVDGRHDLLQLHADGENRADHRSQAKYRDL